MVVADGAHEVEEALVDGRVGFAQHQGMVSIGRHAAHTEQEQGAQGDDIRISGEKILAANKVGLRRAGAAAAAAAVGRHLVVSGPVDQGDQPFRRLVVEADIGDRGERPSIMRRASASVISWSSMFMGVADQGDRQVVLQGGR